MEVVVITWFSQSVSSRCRVLDGWTWASLVCLCLGGHNSQGAAVVFLCRLSWSAPISWKAEVVLVKYTGAPYKSIFQRRLSSRGGVPGLSDLLESLPVSQIH